MLNKYITSHKTVQLECMHQLCLLVFRVATHTMTVCLNLLLLANGPLCVRTNLRARPWSGWGGQPIQLKPGQTFLTETGKPPIWSRDSSPI